MLTEQLAVRTGAGLKLYGLLYADSCADMGNTQYHSQSPIWILDVDRCASIVERRLFSMLGCSALILVLYHIIFHMSDRIRDHLFPFSYFSD